LTRRWLLVLLGATALIAAAGSSPLVARAGSPNPISVSPTDPGPVPYTGSVSPGEPDPTGPPAPSCTPPDGTTGCDDETVSLNSGGISAAQYTFGLVATISYTPSDPAGQNALDVGILDSSRNLIVSSVGVKANTPVTAGGLSPGSYIVEVDADGTIAGLTPQTFTMAVRATATPKQPVTGGTAAPVSFTHEVTVDPNRNNGEPDVAIANNGREMYTSGPWGFTTTVSMAWKSEDAGVQWDLLHGSCPSNPLRPFCSRGGGDSEVELGTPATPGGEQPAYFADLNGLVTLTCALSTNGGDIAPPPNAAGPQGQACNVLNDSTQPSPPGSDRQWIAVWPPADNATNHDDYFMVYDTGETPPGGDDAMMSLDGGQSLTVACRTVAPPSTSTTSCVGGPNAFGSRPGPLVINPVAINTVTTSLGDRWPTLYEFMGTNSTGPEVNISCDGGQHWSNELIDPNSKVGGLTITNDFVVGAIDTAGGLYVAWAQQEVGPAGQWEVLYSHSTDSAGTSQIGNCSIPVQGAQGHWSTPVNLTGPGSAAPAVNFGVMPAIAAGDPGRVDVAYYGSTDPSTVDPATASSMTWYLHMAQSVDGQSAGGGFGDAVASETPMHRHSICFSGLDCCSPRG
jgi:hypothetical protein